MFTIRLTWKFKFLLSFLLLIAIDSVICLAGIKTKQLAMLTPKQRISTATQFKLIAKDSSFYSICNYTNDTTFWSGGLLTKFDLSGKVYFFQQFTSNAQRLVPKAISIDNENNIVVLSELGTYIYMDSFYGGQILNLRKFSQDGLQIYNMSDTLSPKNTLMSIFPLGFDHDNYPIVINTAKPEVESVTLLDSYDSSGRFKKSFRVDSSINVFDTANKTWIQEKFEVENFTLAPDHSIYCYGNRQMLFENIQDTLSSYVMMIDSNYRVKWKTIIYNGIITGCTTIASGDAVFVGLDSKCFIMKINSNGVILWKKFFNTGNYFARPTKVIETANGDFFVVGSAKTSSTSDKDRYIAKLTKDGDLIWEDKDGLPINEAYVDIIEFAPNMYVLTDAHNASISFDLFEDKGTDIIDDKIINRGLLTCNPNPANDFIEVSDIKNKYNTLVDVVEAKEIYNMLGECVKYFQNSSTHQGVVTIDISSLPPGLYFVRYGSEYGKFIKE
jgi:hypothetical protein